MAINDILPPKAARRDAIANSKSFWELRDTSHLVSMVSFTFTMLRHLIRLTAATFTSSNLQSLVRLRLPCNAWQRSRTQNLQRVGKISGAISTPLWTKVHDIYRRRRRPFILSDAFARLSVTCRSEDTRH